MKMYEGKRKLLKSNKQKVLTTIKYVLFLAFSRGTNGPFVPLVTVPNVINSVHKTLNVVYFWDFHSTAFIDFSHGTLVNNIMFLCLSEILSN